MIKAIIGSVLLYIEMEYKTTLQIYKDSGTWKDYVRSTPFMPFKSLVSLTLKTDDPNILTLNTLKMMNLFSFKRLAREKNEKIEMEKIYPDNCINELLPHY